MSPARGCVARVISMAGSAMTVIKLTAKLVLLITSSDVSMPLATIYKSSSSKASAASNLEATGKGLTWCATSWKSESVKKPFLMML